MGVYTFSGVSGGYYQIEVQVPGFTNFRLDNLAVVNGAKVQADARLVIGGLAERVTVAATNDETFTREIWGPAWPAPWDVSLSQLANDLEDWVSETAFAWGQQRRARVPD